MKNFLIEILTPEKAFFSGRVESLHCNTPDGEIGILAGHETMIAVLSAGKISFKVDGTWKNAFHSDGFLEVRPDETLIFTEYCEWQEEDYLADVEKERKQVEKYLSQHRSGSTVEQEKIALTRAMARLQQKGKKTKLE